MSEPTAPAPATLTGAHELIDELGAEPGPGQPGRRVARPPVHWAELAPDERRSAVEAQGLPAFRADQVSRHYFERQESDPAGWSDLPATARAGLAGLFPPLLEVLSIL